MQQFTISDIEQLTGIKAHTLRIWEQRYDFFKPKRKESRHRFYDNEDLKRLLRIAFLYHSGYKVSKINALSENEINEAVRTATVADGKYGLHIVQLIERAIDFDEQRFVQQLNSVIDTIGFERTILHVCYPFLIRVGLLWSANNLIPAQEHFSTYLIQRKIIAETDRLTNVPLSNKAIVLFTPKGEQHEMPLLFINYLLKKTGWQTIYLGASQSLETLKYIVEARNATHIYLHLLTNLSGFEVDDLLEKICTTFPKQKVFASGTGIYHAQRNFLNLIYLKSDEEIKKFIGVTI
ncbi:MAG: helix-turn-helix-type transcriptional regulator [Chitinophagaceae bacterium]